MKLETLARRLAEKTGTPQLEKVILGEAEVKTLPMDHMIWTGAKKCVGSRKNGKIWRDANNMPSISVVTERPYGVVQWQGKNIAVQRLIFQLATKPNYPFRMWCDCGIALCVNPLHFTVQDLDTAPPVPDETIMIGDADSWSEDEVLELTEILLTEHEPKSWEDVVASQVLLGAPEEMVKQTLRKLNKGHLT